MRLFEKTALQLVFFLLGLTFLNAQEPALPDASEAAKAILFVNSSPIRARVILDGEPLAGETPLMLRNLESGEHEVQILKEDYRLASRTLDLAPGEVAELDIELVKKFWRPAFPDEQELIVHGNPMETGDNLFRLPEGTYNVSRQGTRLDLEPVYPYQNVITALNISLPVFLSFSAVLTLQEMLLPSDTDLPLPPALLTSYIINLGMISLDVALHVRKGKFMRDFAAGTDELAGSSSAVREQYERAEELLAAGELSRALNIYSRITAAHRDSEYFPPALYKIAKIHLITGKDSLAILEFRLITSTFPLADLYDKAQKALADIYLSQGSYEQSRSRLDTMVLYDPLFTAEQIDSYRCEILERWVETEEERLEELIGCYEKMLALYPGSESADSYRYRLAVYLLRAERKDEASALLEAIPADIEDPELARNVEELRARLEAE
jgi:tetratricopeptide (TPR) repeat protein